jgi:cyclopropane fatty-acyl-phospholipid synthase-like methyltransferase
MMYEPHEVEWTPEKVARLWGYYASNASYRNQYFSAHSGRAIVARAEREVEVTNRRVLDFGCGRGDLLAHLYAKGIAAQGLEFEQESARETEARFAGEPLFGGVELATSLPSSFPDASFDRIFLVEVVEHLLDDQIEPTLREVHRLLAPDGRVIVTTVNSEDLEASKVACPDCGAIFHRWQHQRSFTADSLAGLFASAGLRTVLAEATFWGATRLVRLRTRVRHPRTPLPQPHLLYIGAPA